MTTKEHTAQRNTFSSPNNHPISLPSPLSWPLCCYALRYVFSSVKPCHRDISVITGSCLQLVVQMFSGWEMILFGYFAFVSQILTHAAIYSDGDNFSRRARPPARFPTGPLPPAHQISGKSSSAALGCERGVCRYRRAGLQGLTLQQEADLQPWTGTIYQHSVACHQTGQTETPWAKVTTQKSVL